jgi:autotransporter-associated beta strand protein
LGEKIFMAGGDNTNTEFAGVLSGVGGSLTKTGTGTMTLSGVNTYTGGTTISGGALSVGSSSALGFESNNLTIGSGTILKATDSFKTSRSTTLGGAGGGVGGTFEVDVGKTLEYTSSSVISGTGSLIKTGTGTLSLGGIDTYTGGTYIKAGTLVSTSNQAPGPQPSPGSNDYAHHIYDGATLQIAVGSWSTERQIELMGDAGGMANIDITNGFTQQRNGLIYGAGGLNLNGTGRMTVTNANTYTGGTVIQNGTLQVNNSTGSATGTGAVTVKTAGTLSGLPTAQGIYSGITGSVTGPVTVESGGNLLTQSGGTLTLGGLTLNAGALSTFHLGALTATKLINITGSDLFNLAGASTVEIVNTGLMAVGTYTLFGYAGVAPVFANLSLVSTHLGVFKLALVNNVGNASIDLLVEAINNQWVQPGGGNKLWSTVGNWFLGVVPDSTGADADFGKNAGSGFGTNAETVMVDTSKTVGSINFNNADTAFTIDAVAGQSAEAML